MHATIQPLIEQAVREDVFPGCAALIGSRTKDLFAGTAGFLSAAGSEPVTRETIYDLASITKVLVTGTLAAQAMHEKILALDQPARHYLAELPGGYTIRHLLTHASGLPDWRPYYEDAPLAAEMNIRRVFYLRSIAAEPLIAKPGEKSCYSDLGFILLGMILEKVFAAPLADLARARIFTPLGLPNTTFKPKSSARVAPTQDCPFRKKIMCGEVDDLNAWALGGVAGHAGVFGTAADLGQFARAVLKSLQGEGSNILPTPALHTFARQQNLPPGSTWALAWDTPSPDASSTGSAWPQDGIGHLGFTGTSLWLAPRQDLFAILLSNRVHPRASNQKIRAFRPAFHDLVVKTYLQGIKIDD